MKSFTPPFIAGYCFLFTQPVNALENAHASYPPPTAFSAGSIVQIVLSLLMVLAAIVLVAWMLKRMNLTQKGNINGLKIITSVAVGQRERVVVLEIAGTWLVVGIAPNQIRTLHTLPKSTDVSEAVNDTTIKVPFNAWLKKMIEKHNAS